MKSAQPSSFPSLPSVQLFSPYPASHCSKSKKFVPKQLPSVRSPHLQSLKPVRPPSDQPSDMRPPPVRHPPADASDASASRRVELVALRQVGARRARRNGLSTNPEHILTSHRSARYGMLHFVTPNFFARSAHHQLRSTDSVPLKIFVPHILRICRQHHFTPKNVEFSVTSGILPL